MQEIIWQLHRPEVIYPLAGAWIVLWFGIVGWITWRVCREPQQDSD